MWGNTLRVTVDKDTLNPASLFNLTVTEYVAAGGSLVPGASESFRNLTMNSSAPTYAVDTINDPRTTQRGAARPGPRTLSAASDAGTSTGDTPVTGVTIASGSRIAISANGEAPVEISFGPATRAAAIEAAIAAALVRPG